jgi:hypothetical protein
MTSATNTQLPGTRKDRGLGRDLVLMCAVSAPPIGKRDMNKSRVITVGSAAAVLALTAGTASAATSMITSHDIKDGTVRRVDLSEGVNSALTKGTQPGTAGTIYRVAHYTGGSNGGGIATVACAVNDEKSQKYVAVSGGVQILDADGDSNSADDNNVAVADSFPGRMDWSTTSPKAGRLDGWIVRFGDNTKSAAQVNVWAVCMPKADDVKVQTNNY